MKNHNNKLSSYRHAVSVLSAVYLSLSLLSATAVGDKTTVSALQSNSKAVKTIKVRNDRQLKNKLKLAMATNYPAIVITCHPPDHEWCAGDFQTACDNGGGGLSTEPDGGISCSAETE